jgi:ubiquinone/menaquinone biosynthesis C-methylase UbiE/DNA-binding MarR family transcriptional regulator
MGTEALQKVFKTLADPTRMRILFLLERQELAVQELMEVLGMAQSRVSRHLGILRAAGLLRDRRDGTFVLYRFTLPEGGQWREAWKLVSRSLGEDATAERDLAALAGVIEARASQSRSFFDSVGPEWDALRRVWSDDLLRARALARLIRPGLRVADIGTGTGALALELARAGLQVVAIDHSKRMLDAARAKLEADPGLDVELRLGDASSLPLSDGEVDAAFAHMVLQYLASPIEALREMARVVRPGGSVVVVDFVRHDREWMREELGVLRLGFTAEEIVSGFISAGLPEPRIEIQAPASRAADLPETFIASAERPRQ